MTRRPSKPNLLGPSHLSHAFIMEQIEKCRTKMGQGDYDGAITNARSLAEAVLAAIEKEWNSNAPDYDGDLPKLYKCVQKHLNLSPENPKISNSLKQTLTGFISIIGGLFGLSNRCPRPGTQELVCKNCRHLRSNPWNRHRTWCPGASGSYASQR
jgi:hypothetical protein